jgi:hypothetical protein
MLMVAHWRLELGMCVAAALGSGSWMMMLLLLHRRPMMTRRAMWQKTG